jgi:hypothetical protein
MSHALICSWLNLPPTSWPPDHYTLLGLRAGETDLARIERNVQLRMEKVRVYQLAHPELATEVMNRIAQAFDCLRNPEARKAYDAALLKTAGPASMANASATPAAPSPPEGKPSASGWLPAATLSEPSTPKPDTLETQQNKATMPQLPQAVLSAEAPADADVATIAPPPPDGPVDPALQAARAGPARRGIGTKRALYQRISRTRQLIRAWVQSGKYLGDARYKLSQKTEAIDLVRQLTIIRQQLREFPPLLGEAGQPGYLVIALARQPEIVKTFQSLLPSQRKSYVRDWQTGLTFLAAYRLFLREELWELRRRTRLGRLCKAVRAMIMDHPSLWLMLVALITANIAFRPLRSYWHVEVVVAAALLALFVLYQNVTRRRSFHRSRRRPVQG